MPPMDRAQPGFTSRGYTLVEILVVMVIIGLLAGVALPRLYDLARRFEISAQRDKLLIDIGNLGYRAYQTGQAMQLGAPDAAQTPGGAIIAPLTIPPGWKMELSQPIHYSFNGVCSGGQLILHDPDNRTESLTLSAPLCLPTSLPPRPQP